MILILSEMILGLAYVLYSWKSEQEALMLRKFPRVKCIRLLEPVLNKKNSHSNILFLTSH